MVALKVGLAAVAVTGALAGVGMLTVDTGKTTQTVTHRQPVHGAAAGFDETTPGSDVPFGGNCNTQGVPNGDGFCTLLGIYPSQAACNTAATDVFKRHSDWTIRCMPDDKDPNQYQLWASPGSSGSAPSSGG